MSKSLRLNILAAQLVNATQGDAESGAATSVVPSGDDHSQKTKSEDTKAKAGEEIDCATSDSPTCWSEWISSDINAQFDKLEEEFSTNVVDEILELAPSKDGSAYNKDYASRFPSLYKDWQNLPNGGTGKDYTQAPPAMSVCPFSDYASGFLSGEDADWDKTILLNDPNWDGKPDDDDQNDGKQSSQVQKDSENSKEKKIIARQSYIQGYAYANDSDPSEPGYDYGLAAGKCFGISSLVQDPTQGAVDYSLSTKPYFDSILQFLKPYVSQSAAKDSNVNPNTPMPPVQLPMDIFEKRSDHEKELSKDGLDGLVIKVGRQTGGKRPAARMHSTKNFGFDDGGSLVIADIGRMPRGAGLWAAFWSYGARKIAGRGWPDSGEIDYMERPWVIKGDDELKAEGLDPKTIEEGDPRRWDSAWTMTPHTRWGCSAPWKDLEDFKKKFSPALNKDAVKIPKSPKTSSEYNNSNTSEEKDKDESSKNPEDEGADEITHIGEEDCNTLSGHTGCSTSVESWPTSAVGSEQEKDDMWHEAGPHFNKRRGGIFITHQAAKGIQMFFIPRAVLEGLEEKHGGFVLKKKNGEKVTQWKPTALFMKDLLAGLLTTNGPSPKRILAQFVFPFVEEKDKDGKSKKTCTSDFFDRQTFILNTTTCGEWVRNDFMTHFEQDLYKDCPGLIAAGSEKSDPTSSQFTNDGGDAFTGGGLINTTTKKVVDPETGKEKDVEVKRNAVEGAWEVGRDMKVFPSPAKDYEWRAHRASTTTSPDGTGAVVDNDENGLGMDWLLHGFYGLELGKRIKWYLEKEKGAPIVIGPGTKKIVWDNGSKTCSATNLKQLSESPKDLDAKCKKTRHSVLPPKKPTPETPESDDSCPADFDQAKFDKTGLDCAPTLCCFDALTKAESGSADVVPVPEKPTKADGPHPWYGPDNQLKCCSPEAEAASYVGMNVCVPKTKLAQIQEPNGEFAWSKNPGMKCPDLNEKLATKPTKPDSSQQDDNDNDSDDELTAVDYQQERECAACLAENLEFDNDLNDKDHPNSKQPKQKKEWVWNPEQNGGTCNGVTVKPPQPILSGCDMLEDEKDRSLCVECMNSLNHHKDTNSSYSSKNVNKVHISLIAGIVSIVIGTLLF